MKLPRNISKLHTIAAKEHTRYAMASVQLEQKADTFTARVTDGRRLLEASWKEEEAQGEASVLIERKSLQEACKLAKPSAKQLREDEEASTVSVDLANANGAVSFEAKHKGGEARAACLTVEGAFPDPGQLFFEVERGREYVKHEDTKRTAELREWRQGVSNGPRPTQDPLPARSVIVNPRYLAELLLAMAEAQDENPAVELVIPEGDPKCVAPIGLFAYGYFPGPSIDRIEYRGLLMPFSTC